MRGKLWLAVSRSPLFNIINGKLKLAAHPMKAIWNNTVVAESDDTVVVENNHYFPADSIKKEFFEDSIAHTSCPWKGRASYYSLRVNGDLNKDAAWYYPEASPAAANIQGRVAFWKGVKIEK
jgi:uncharacterized protein (DUF427 family)